jgi:hypothetical protein
MTGSCPKRMVLGPCGGVRADARAYDVRPDVTQVFDLDGPRLAALAAPFWASPAWPA